MLRSQTKKQCRINPVARRANGWEWALLPSCALRIPHTIYWASFYFEFTWYIFPFVVCDKRDVSTEITEFTKVSPIFCVQFLRIMYAHGLNDNVHVRKLNEKRNNLQWKSLSYERATAEEQQQQRTTNEKKKKTFFSVVLYIHTRKA